MSRPSETDLYPPVKSFLEGLGYEVKSEIGNVDVLAVRGDGPPVVVELKTGFSLSLLKQGVARQTITEQVYLAVPRWRGKAGWQAFKGNMGLCRRLALGLLSVQLPEGLVEVHCEPAPFQPRQLKRRRAGLLTEFRAREGDPNLGGTSGKIVTAYRQDAERCLQHLGAAGPSKGAAVAKATGVARATRMMADNHYGWFERIERGVYGLTEAGRRYLDR